MRAGTLAFLASFAPLTAVAQPPSPSATDTAAQPTPPPGVPPPAAPTTTAPTTTAPTTTAPAAPGSTEPPGSAAPGSTEPPAPAPATPPSVEAPASPPATPPASGSSTTPDGSVSAGDSPGPSADASVALEVRDSPSTKSDASPRDDGGSPLGFGLGAYGGLTALFDVGTRGSYSFLGGLLRARYGNFTAGGYYELSDSPETRSGEWWGAGGTAGVWLPYPNWVDFQLALRAGYREYLDGDSRFGPGGYRAGGPTLGLLLGVSDRSMTGVWAGRVGGAVFAAYDLKQHERDWRYEVPSDSEDDRVVIEGTSHIGGFSLGLILEVGLDVEP